MMETNAGSYGIGAVVKRTGLAAPTIRIWEKRYGAVTPDRTETNRRLYSFEDVARLTLLRSLTERGHSIGNIANLSLPQLQEQLAGDERSSVPVSETARPAKRGRLLVVAQGAGENLLNDPVLDVDVVGQFEGLPMFGGEKKLPATDLLFIEAETLHPETVSAVREGVRRTAAARTILLYRFSSSKTATALAKAIPGLTLLPAPVDNAQLRREVLLQLGSLFPSEESVPSSPDQIPERLYSSDQLMKFTRIGTAVDCECPQHLAGLLQSLSAFEKYSRECEDRSPQDALLHAFLHRSTASARRAMEEALQHLFRIEGIVVE